jgi:hypothetical protein
MEKIFLLVCGAMVAANTATAQQAFDMSAQDHAIRHFAQDDEAGYNMRSLDWSDGNEALRASSGGRSTYEATTKHFAQVDEPEFGLRRWSAGTFGGMVTSASGGSRDELSAYAAAMLDNGERGDN